MSVIWSGVTEEGAVVPVQVTAEGKVVAVGDGPEGEFLKLTGGNLTGDLTVNEQITLATDGSASFAGEVDVSGLNFGGTSAGKPDDKGRLQKNGSLIVDRTTGASDVVVGRYNGTVKSQIRGDGSATFAGNVTTGGGVSASVEKVGSELLVGSKSCTLTLQGNNPSDTANAFNVYKTALNRTVKIGYDGSATFSGDVVIGSRGDQWLIRESNGVAMLVQQTLLKQPEIEKLRDLPNELDLIEAALNEIMDKLRMTPPAGWPVWDGSDNA